MDDPYANAGAGAPSRTCWRLDYLFFGFISRLRALAGRKHSLSQRHLPGLQGTAEDPRVVVPTLCGYIDRGRAKQSSVGTAGNESLLLFSLIRLIKTPLLIAAVLDIARFAVELYLPILQQEYFAGKIMDKDNGLPHTVRSLGWKSALTSAKFAEALTAVVLLFAGLKFLEVMFTRHSHFLVRRMRLRLETGVNGVLLRAGLRSEASCEKGLQRKGESDDGADEQNKKGAFCAALCDLENFLDLLDYGGVLGAPGGLLSLFVKLPWSFFLLVTKMNEGFDKVKAAAADQEKPNFVPAVLIVGFSYTAIILVLTFVNAYFRARFSEARGKRISITAGAFSNLRALKMYRRSERDLLQNRLLPSLMSEIRERQMLEVIRRILFITDMFPEAAVIVLLALFGPDSMLSNLIIVGQLMRTFCDSLMLGVVTFYSCLNASVHFRQVNRYFRSVLANVDPRQGLLGTVGGGDGFDGGEEAEGVPLVSGRRVADEGGVGAATRKEDPFETPDGSCVVDGTTLSFGRSFALACGDVASLRGGSASSRTAILLSLLGEAEHLQTATDGAKLYRRPDACAYAPAQAVVFSQTIRENILLGLDFVDLYYKTALLVAGLDVDLTAFPERDHTQVASGGDNLSGGQKQRLSLARAVYHCLYAVGKLGKPCLLCLDDPVSALDEPTSKLVLTRLTQLFRGTTNVAVLLSVSCLNGISDLKAAASWKVADLSESGSSESSVCVTMSDSAGECSVSATRFINEAVSGFLAELIGENEQLEQCYLADGQSPDHAGKDSLDQRLEHFETFGPLKRTFSSLGIGYCLAGFIGIFCMSLTMMARATHMGTFKTIGDGGEISDATKNSLFYKVIGQPTSKNAALPVLALDTFVAVAFLAINFIFAQAIGGFVGVRKLAEKAYRTIFLRKPLIGFFDREKMGVVQNRLATGTGLDLYNIFGGRGAFSLPMDFVRFAAVFSMFFVAHAINSGGLIEAVVLFCTAVVATLGMYCAIVKNFRRAISDTQERYLISRSLRDECFMDIESVEARRVLRVLSVRMDNQSVPASDQKLYQERRTGRHIVALTRSQYATYALQEHFVLYMSLVCVLIFFLVLASQLVQVLVEPDNLNGKLPAIMGMVQQLMYSLCDEKQGFFPKLPALEGDLIAFQRLLQYVDDIDNKQERLLLELTNGPFGGGDQGGAPSGGKFSKSSKAEGKSGTCSPCSTVATGSASPDDFSSSPPDRTMSLVSSCGSPRSPFMVQGFPVHFSASGVTIAYPYGSSGQQTVVALRDFDLSVHQGEKVVVTGRSGSGKSSFFMAALDLVRLQTGEIVLHAQPEEILNSSRRTRPAFTGDDVLDTTVNDTDPQRRLVCAFPQSALALESLSFFENVHPTFSSNVSKKFKQRAFPVLKRLLGSVASHDLRSKLPHLSASTQNSVVLAIQSSGKGATEDLLPDSILYQYFDGELCSDAVSSLTVCQRHTLHIVRVLVRSAEQANSQQSLFLLDEVTCGLTDEEAVQVMSMLLEEIGPQGTVVCIAHQECLVRLFDRRVELLGQQSHRGAQAA